MQELISFLEKHVILSTIAVILIVLLAILELLRQRMHQTTIPPSELTQLINRDNAVVIDVRNSDAYKKAHIIDALSFSSKELTDGKKLEKFKKRPIIITDQTGPEARKIALKLRNKGYNAYSLAGGIQAWTNADMPLVKG